MTTARALLSALAEGREEEAWKSAQTLAREVLDAPTTVLARSVLDAGPFAMRKAEELAEEVLADGGATVGARRGGGPSPI